MNDNEVHYLTYDPDEIWAAMTQAYMEAGGDVLYPGDEKEILLRGVQEILVQAFAGVDNALRMATLRYAVREYLNLYGEGRNCYRIAAAAATAKVEITFRTTNAARTIVKGTPLVAPDGEMLYLLAADVNQTGYEETVTADVICGKTGGGGNGLLAGMQMQFLSPLDAVVSVFCVENASGGQDEEADETYRERIRRYGLTSIATGPEVQYESAAMDVTSEILDANAVNGGAGIVNVYLLLSSDVGADTIIEAVKAKLNARNVRPLTDQVVVAKADAIPYRLNVRYATGDGRNLAAEVTAAIEEYKKWQDETIGRAFNPDRLMAMVYQAGASRVIWGEGSNFNGGSVAYTEIDEKSHCQGVINMEVIA